MDIYEVFKIFKWLPRTHQHVNLILLLIGWISWLILLGNVFRLKFVEKKAQVVNPRRNKVVGVMWVTERGSNNEIKRRVYIHKKENKKKVKKNYAVTVSGLSFILHSL